MWEILAYALIALGSVVSQVVTNKSNKQINQENLDWQERMQDKENEYSTPKNQTQRLQDAGINPISGIMSNGLSVSGNTSATHGTPQQIPMQDIMSSLGLNASNVSNSFKLYSEGKKNLTLTEFEKERIKAQTADYLANVQKLEVDTKGQMIANEYAAAMNEAILAEKKSISDLNYWQVKQVRQSIRNMKFELENSLPQQIKESESRIQLNVLEQDKIVAEIERIFYENAESEAHTEQMAAETDLTKAQTKTEGNKAVVLANESKLQKLEYKDLDKQIQFFLDTYDYQVSKVASEAKISKRQAWLIIIQSFLGGARDAAGTAAGAAIAAKTVSSMSKAATVVGF